MYPKKVPVLTITACLLSVMLNLNSMGVVSIHTMLSVIDAKNSIADLQLLITSQEIKFR